MSNEQKPKGKMDFTIIKNDPTDGHRGFGIGSLSLENVTPLMVDVTEEVVTIEVGAMHARSPIERGLKFTMDREDSAGGKKYWLIWVTIEHNESGPFYSGVTACELVVNREKRRGYKNFVEHMNKMDKSLKGHIIVEEMDDLSKRLLADFLQGHNEDMWNNSDSELSEQLAIK